MYTKEEYERFRRRVLLSTCTVGKRWSKSKIKALQRNRAQEDHLPTSDLVNESWYEVVDCHNPQAFDPHSRVVIDMTKYHDPLIIKKSPRPRPTEFTTTGHPLRKVTNARDIEPPKTARSAPRAPGKTSDKEPKRVRDNRTGKSGRKEESPEQHRTCGDENSFKDRLVFRLRPRDSRRGAKETKSH
uniref:ARAD1D29172p n=1 Tax=Blastobotrys adeninivorans TaxID=409370 RepID=A0A060TB94_BLAAD